MSYFQVLPLVLALTNTFAMASDVSSLNGIYALDSQHSDPDCTYLYDRVYANGWPKIGPEQLVIETTAQGPKFTLRTMQKKDTDPTYLQADYTCKNLNGDAIKGNATRDEYGVKSREIVSSTWDGSTLKFSREVRSGFIILTRQLLEIKSITRINASTLKYQGWIPWQTDLHNSGPRTCLFKKN